MYTIFEPALYRYTLQSLKRVYLYETFGHLLEIGSNMSSFGGVRCEHVLALCNGALDLELSHVSTEGVSDL